MEFRGGNTGVSPSHGLWFFREFICSNGVLLCNPGLPWFCIIG